MFKKFVSVVLAVALVFSSNSVKNSKCEAAEVVAGASVGMACGGPPGAAVGAVVGGLIIVGGLMLAAEHTKGKRPSTHDKHTKPRSGRPTTKNRQNPNWQGNLNKRHG